MLASPRPRRSVLYMPGSNPRALEKARSLAADGFIFDLEDAVAPDAKAAARDAVARALAAGGYGGREVMLRVNAPTTVWGDADLVAAAAMPIDAVLLPKIEDASAVHQAEAALAQAGASGRLAIWCMVETPLGVLHAERIASASSRVAGLVMGTSDLAKDLRVLPTRDRSPLLTALGLCVLAARAYGLAILDGVHLDLADDAGFLAACRQGRELGFDGKTLIHPTQIAICNETFAPTAEEIAHAKAILAAFERPENHGKGVLQIDGKMVQLLHAQMAKRTLAIAEAIAKVTAPAA